ncbi:unnamed protein product [Parnassius mnemosyne]|uniref:DUF5641 domain-containing protein n=1 Tax=Parnassius mnemosyne TaxID=213953 RepID=A0AAV1LYT6_9NEOP
MIASAYINQMFEFKPLQSSTANNFDLFTDNFISAVRALQNLKLDNLADLIVLHIALKKLDSDTIRSFEYNHCSIIPTFDDLVNFIKTRSKVLQRTDSSTNSSSPSNSRRGNDNNRRCNNISSPKYQAYVSTTASCSKKCLCDNIVHQHLFKCADFNKMTPLERFKCVKSNNACVNCLSLSHRVSNCASNFSCRVCKFNHHTLLHFQRESDNSSSALPPPQPQQTVLKAAAPAPTTPAYLPPLTSGARSDVALCTSFTNVSQHSPPPARSFRSQKTVLLSTAQVFAHDAKGEKQLIRVLLDSASQSHFITKECCHRLGVQQHESECTVVKGFGGVEKIVKSKLINIKIFSRFNSNINFNISPLVVDEITDRMATAVVDKSVLAQFNDIRLADECYGVPNKIDVLIGASLFPHLLCPDVIHSSNNLSGPAALNTVFGYVIMGSVPTIQYNQSLTCCTILESPAIDKLVQRFWELEQPPSASPIQCPSDIECEEFYKSTTSRDPDSGRYIVGLPFKDDVYSLGDSYETARRRFMCLERKLQASPILRLEYDDVIKEYLAKNYISPAPPYDSHDPAPIYVIPHHGVLREDKKSTRLRIVLDASSKTNTGRALNDILHSGPNLQGDLFNIILNFRLHPVAMTADYRQQFLQIIVRDSDLRYQCFIYRFRPHDPLVLYHFNRVCFGLTSSPYHALRTVRQLIDDDGAKYPLAGCIASTSLYMDHIAFSLPSESEASDASQQLIGLFKGAQWDLIKWNSNRRSVLDDLPASHKITGEVEFDKLTQHKILGLYWSTDSDAFYFKITVPADVTCTKRSILSTVARLWDIMGFVAPAITDNIPADNFYHVTGTENPADILSRGVTPNKLVSYPLWLRGPQWTSLDPSQWPLHTLDNQDISDMPETRISSHTVLLHRHSLLDKLVQSFWDRWRMEYLHGLQVRQKWNTSSTPIAPGTVVVVINDNAPSLAWPLAIVESVHSSKDGVARVVTVRTSKGTYLRPVVRICPLPKQ